MTRKKRAKPNAFERRLMKERRKDRLQGKKHPENTPIGELYRGCVWTWNEALFLYREFKRARRGRK